MSSDSNGQGSKPWRTRSVRNSVSTEPSWENSAFETETAHLFEKEHVLIYLTKPMRLEP